VSIIIEEDHNVVVNSAEDVLVSVQIVNGKVTRITISEIFEQEGFKPEPDYDVNRVVIPSDGSLMSLMKLRRQIAEVIDKAKKHVRIVDAIEN